MLHRALCALVFVGLVAWPVDARAQRATRGLHAEQLTTVIHVLSDGSLQVSEQITFRFSERTFREVERRVPIRHADDIVDVEVLMDGRVLPPGDGEGQAELRKRRRELRVLWRFPETIDATHTFELRYRAVGAVRLDGGRGRIAWHVLPTRHRYAITVAETILHLRDPLVSLGGPAMEAEGWTWSQLSHGGWMARKHNVAVNEGAILTDTIDGAGFAGSTPQWQFHEERAAQLAPAFIVGALVILVMGIGMMVMMSLRYHRPRTDPGAAVPADRSSLPPALGTALVPGRPAVGLAQVSATFFDLLGRGVLALVETSQPGASGKSRTFDVVVPAGATSGASLRPHERVVVEALAAKAEGGRLALTQAQRRLFAGHRAFREAAIEEIIAAGLVDPERRWAGQGMTIAGAVSLIVGLACLVATAVILPMFGGAVYLIAGSIIMLGILFLAHGQSFRTLSTAGAGLGAQWAARVKLLKDEAKAGRAGGLVDQWLPVAIGAGLGRQFGASGATVSWLRGVNNPSGALVAIIASSGSAGGGYGGAAGMGGGVAGGGGFSGAR
jgi:hypothetical protein